MEKKIINIFVLALIVLISVMLIFSIGDFKFQKEKQKKIERGIQKAPPSINAEITSDLLPVSDRMAPMRVWVSALESTVNGKKVSVGCEPNMGSSVKDISDNCFDYRTLKFEWNFGDPNGKNAEYNVQSGGNFHGAYVYDNPGTYTIRLKVTDPVTGAIGTKSETFTVSAFSGKSYYFADNGNDLNTCSQVSPCKSLNKVESLVNSENTDGDNQAIRLLFKRGDFFNERNTDTQFNNIDRIPLVVFDDFGSEGMKPHIDMGNNGQIRIERESNNFVFSDLEFKRDSHVILNPVDDNEAIFRVSHKDRIVAPNNLLFQRLDLMGSDTGIYITSQAFDPQGKSKLHGITLLDNEIKWATTYLAYFPGVRQIALIGNLLKGHGHTGGHLVRFEGSRDILLHKNRLEDPSMRFTAGRSTIRFIGEGWTSAAALEYQQPKYILMSENVVHTARGGNAIDMAPNSGLNDGDGHAEHIIIEKNYFFPSAAASKTNEGYIRPAANDVTIRNNIFVGQLKTLESVMTPIRISSREKGNNNAPLTHNIWILGNSFYAPFTSPGKPIWFIWVDGFQNNRGFAPITGDTGNLVVKNNIIKVDGSTTPSSGMIRIEQSINSMIGDGQLIEDHNYLDFVNSDFYISHAGTQDKTLSQWKATGQGTGTLYIDPDFRNPKIGEQSLTLSNSAGFDIDERVYGLTTGASGIIKSKSGNTIRVFGIMKDRPFSIDDRGTDSNLINLGKYASGQGFGSAIDGSRSNLNSVSSWSGGEDYSLSSNSPAIGSGVFDRRLFEDYNGNWRPGSFAKTGMPSMGAIDPLASGGEITPTPPPPTIECGNGIIEPGEVCDGNTRNCFDLNGNQGLQNCNSQCSGFGTCIPNTNPSELTLDFSSDTPDLETDKLQIPVGLVTNGDEHYSFVNFNNDVISWYKFENSFLDRVGSNHGFGNSILFNDGKYGRASDFNSVGDYVSIPTMGWNVNKISFSIWAKADAFRSEFPQYLFGESSNPSGYENQIQIYTDDAAGFLDLGINGHTTSLGIVNLPVDTWFNVVLTIAGTNYKMYYNGFLVSSGDYTSTGKLPLDSFGSVATIGNVGPMNLLNEGWNGNIDEVIVFDKTLEIQEVKSLFDSSLNQYEKTYTGLIEGKTYNFEGYAADIYGDIKMDSRNVLVNTGIEVGSVCGNDLLEPGEECDDGNTISGDGCSSECLIEVRNCEFLSADWSADSAFELDRVTLTVTGSECFGRSIKISIFEDDSDAIGNPDDFVTDNLNPTLFNLGGISTASWTVVNIGDGFGGFGLPEYYFVAELEEDVTKTMKSGLLQMETTSSIPECGNGSTEPEVGEECDDGNTVSGDGCSNLCINEFCGDGIIQSGLGEECDDGNTVSGDGCSVLCLNEDSGEINVCENACDLNGKCVVYGFRTNLEYCNVDTDNFVVQKDNEEICNNDFECKSNSCIDRSCTEQGLLARIIEFFRILCQAFGRLCPIQV